MENSVGNCSKIASAASVVTYGPWAGLESRQALLP